MMSTYILVVLVLAAVACMVTLLWPDKRKPKGDEPYDPWDDWMGA